MPLRKSVEHYFQTKVALRKTKVCKNQLEILLHIFAEALRGTEMVLHKTAEALHRVKILLHKTVEALRGTEMIQFVSESLSLIIL